MASTNYYSTLRTVASVRVMQRAGHPDVPFGTPQLPAAPGQPTVGSITSSGAVGTFVSDTGNPTVTAKRVYLDGVKYGPDLSPSTPTVTFTGLAGLSSHSFYETLVNSAGEGPASPPRPFTTLASGSIPTAPNQPTVSSITDTTATGTWTETSDPSVTGKRVYLNGVKVGADLGLVLTKNLTNLQPATNYNSPGLQISRFNSIGESAKSTARTFSTTGSAATPQAPGHVPGRIWLGVDVNESSVNNDWPHAMALIAGYTWNWNGDQARNLPAAAPQATVYSRRYFNGGNWATLANVRNMLNDADDKGIKYPVLSFKIPGNDWAGMAAGDYDSGLAAIAQAANERSDAGGYPFLVCFHHEPNGNGQGADWVAMNRRAAWYLGGRRGGTSTSTYVAGNDVSGTAINGCSVHIIYNAFIFDGTAPSGGSFAVWTNQALIDDLNANRGVWGWDAYDTENAGHRTSDRMQKMYDFGEAHGANCYGIGEWGCFNATVMADCWEIIKQYAAKTVYCDYWNSGANSDADWRIVPTGYPADPAFAVTGVGNATTQARLNYYRNTMLPESETILG